MTVCGATLPQTLSATTRRRSQPRPKIGSGPCSAQIMQGAAVGGLTVLATVVYGIRELRIAKKAEENEDAE